MTAFTSSFGAKNQDYHDDILADSSALMYARSFAPLYSLFFQLQDTPTPEMGPTSICPGTHFCVGYQGSNTKQDMCEKYGYQIYTAMKQQPQPQQDPVVTIVGGTRDMKNHARNTRNTNTNMNTNTTTTFQQQQLQEQQQLQQQQQKYWKAGDVLLMNMNALHRGSEHVLINDDRNDTDRVMIALSIGPKPRSRAESRQISQGSLMSMRYDQWVRTYHVYHIYRESVFFV